MKSQFTAEQWGNAGEYALRHYMAEDGVVPTDAQIAEARAFASALGAGDPDSDEAKP